MYSFFFLEHCFEYDSMLTFFKLELYCIYSVVQQQKEGYSFSLEFSSIEWFNSSTGKPEIQHLFDKIYRTLILIIQSIEFQLNSGKFSLLLIYAINASEPKLLGNICAWVLLENPDLSRIDKTPQGMLGGAFRMTLDKTFKTFLLISIFPKPIFFFTNFGSKPSNSF